jgi:hypothetical protein
VPAAALPGVDYFTCAMSANDRRVAVDSTLLGGLGATSWAPRPRIAPAPAVAAATAAAAAAASIVMDDDDGPRPSRGRRA